MTSVGLSKERARKRLTCGRGAEKGGAGLERGSGGARKGSHNDISDRCGVFFTLLRR
jgi:hypothetical protein